MTKYIEFFGLPGSGKSHAYRYMNKALNARGIRSVPLEQRAVALLVESGQPGLQRLLSRLAPASLLSGFLNSPAVSVHSAKSKAFYAFCETHPEFAALLFENDESRISAAREKEIVLLGLITELIWSYQLAITAANADVLLRDEGFCQRGIALYGFRNVPADITERNASAYFSHMPLPDSVIVTKAPLKELHARLSKRGYPQRMRDMPSEDREITFLRSEKVFTMGAEILKKRGSHVVEIENTGSQAHFEKILDSIADGSKSR